METEATRYISYAEAVTIHFEIMVLFGETRYGIADRTLIESALARPRQAAVYKDADIVRQAATLCFGLIKNHPWIGGNKRTATFIVEEFLFQNGREVMAERGETYQRVLAVEANVYSVDDIENWYRPRTIKIQEIT